MKKIILSVAMVMTMCMTGKAQGTASPATTQQQQPMKTPDERAQRDADRAEKNLGLNADQKTKWQAASLERIKANEPLKNQMRGSQNQADKQKFAGLMRANMQKFDDTVNGFLTADQKTKWEQEKQQRKGMHKGRRNGVKNGGMSPQD